MCPELYRELGWLDEEIAADQPEPGSLVGRCGAGDNYCYLTPWGEVRPCPDVAWDCGRLPDRGDFRTIWKDSPPLNRFREIKEAGGFSGPICDHIRRNNLSAD
ncbi:MAG: hypothetical protein Q8M92_04610 [Candidatus Subteraquimicrobiales bacterium]|nr:hypothetical protein [Candidatus Subteraquimicrobiales bacterium]